MTIPFFVAPLEAPISHQKSWRQAVLVKLNIKSVFSIQDELPRPKWFLNNGSGNIHINQSDCLSSGEPYAISF